MQNPVKNPVSFYPVKKPVKDPVKNLLKTCELSQCLNVTFLNTVTIQIYFGNPGMVQALFDL